MAVPLTSYLRYDFDHPRHPNNDHLIFSKGYVSLPLYSLYKAARALSNNTLALVVVFAMAASLSLMLNAEFIAIVQILIYAGAVTILLLFTQMLARSNNLRTDSNPANRWWWLGTITSMLVGVSGIAAFTLSRYSPAHVGGGLDYGPQNATCPFPPYNAAYIGQLLYSPTCYSYVLSIEIAFLVLLVAIVGAIAIDEEDS